MCAQYVKSIYTTQKENADGSEKNITKVLDESTVGLAFRPVVSDDGTVPIRQIAPSPDEKLPDDCIIPQYPYKKLKGGSRYGRQDFACNCNGMTVGIECKNQSTSGTADEKVYYAFENISRQYKQVRRILILGGKAWAPEIVADLKAKAATREYCALHPEVDVIVATEQEFFEEILPRMFEPMTDEQRSFNEQVAIIERNRQSAIAAQQSAFEAVLRH